MNFRSIVFREFFEPIFIVPRTVNKPSQRFRNRANIPLISRQFQSIFLQLEPQINYL